MFPIIIVIVLVVVVGGLILVTVNKGNAARRTQLEDAKADARRWVERLGGQVMNLTGSDAASKQALADASERYTAAGSQMDQAQTVEQARLAKETALEGLYYVRAARTAMGLDPGPALPEDRERVDAGKVTEDRRVSVEGRDYEASPYSGESTPYYYPGGRVAGRPVPQGWYSEPWWKPALVAGAWGVGSFLLFDAMFSGMHGIAEANAWESGFDAGQADAMADMNGGDFGGGQDFAGYDGGGQDFGGGQDGGGFDWGGGGDWGGGDGGDFGGGGDW